MFDSPFTNRILAALQKSGEGAILAGLSALSLAAGQVLATPATPLTKAYFITSGIASTLITMRNGATVSSNLVGNEGFVGLPFLFGADSFPSATTVMEVSGGAMVLDSSVLIRELGKSGVAQQIMRRYAQTAMVESMQVAACNRLHSVYERLAFFLLQTRDRVGVDFQLTHEQAAQILGCRRATVTTELDLFQSMRLVACGYGRVRITNPQQLEQAACECYLIVRNAREGLLQF